MVASGKEYTNAGDARDMGLMAGLGKCPGEGIGNPLQYSCLGNPMDRGAWQTTVLGGWTHHKRVGHDLMTKQQITGTVRPTVLHIRCNFIIYSTYFLNHWIVELIRFSISVYVSLNQWT